MNHPCIIEFENSLRVTRVLIHGQETEPGNDEPAKTVKMKEGGTTIELKYNRITKTGLSCLIEP